MKNYFFFVIAILISITINAQNIENLEPEFKNMLTNTNCVATSRYEPGISDADTNDDGEISIAEAEAVIHLNFGQYDVTDASGIEYFINLESLNCQYNALSSLNVNTLVNLTYLNCSNNQLTELTGINNLVNLEVLDCGNNALSALDLSNSFNLESIACYNNQLTILTLGELANLIILDCTYNQITSLDVTGSPILQELYCANNQITYLDLSNKAVDTYYYEAQNNQIETLLIKNGSVIDDMISWDFSEFNFSNNPLTYVCGDEDELQLIHSWLAYHEINNCVVSSYCSFIPGGEYYSVEGNIAMDLDSNGCDTNDAVFPNLNFEISNGTETGNFISNATGSYSIAIQGGTHTITPILENPSYFEVTPESVTIDFPTETSPFTQDFCITPIGIYKAIDIQIIPLTAAVPGFEADYRIIYKNIGNTLIDFGQVLLTNHFDLMSEVSFSPSWNSFTFVDNAWHFNFEDLQPFETRTIDFSMLINTPMDTPAVNGSDVLTFNANYFIEYELEDPETAFVLEQTVVNSFDPNDKTCLEGDFITPEMVGDYVHYMIRFENTGTANAENVVVKDHIDISKYDLSSILPLHGSHNFVTRIKNTSEDHYVEFIFENINLPFNDTNNDGYIVFKIKTLDTLALNDTLENEAEIYFDFNFPIVTNIALTTIETLSTDEFELANNTITLYPNPTTHILHLESKQPIKQITICDISGRLIKELAVIGTKTKTTISTQEFSSGTYFVKIKSETGDVVKKIIKA
ncbi:putative repeat protein (TIGR01451 family)/predicted secreted protein (Por secretion system target) [Winogradskyella eximia]|uniref:Putative repeat protein (TIGR01451 family)/predicted secreted protein (Por secretion system target) n=1 Tax=Winogradskyella eximia TaxID=262006 RepID=A0A3D9HB20_9FLAO|nr:T9SS type A sorting domain-containing protein [Winogradskyella eximia]RED46683.1 putative repeat protein (TIGR01451 family)/predicted secreted protein (Por secretion system target) [Winogradskyella eximia]